MGVAPEIDPEWCSLGRLAASTCSACAAACPRGALTAADHGLDLDPGACSSCGACAAACPAGAIDLGGIERPMPDRRTAAEAWLACPRHPQGHRGGAALCLQSIGPETLARLWLAGVRRVACLTADCATCPDGAGGLPLEARVAAFGAILSSRGLPALGFRKALAPPRGAARLRPAEPATPDRGRRQLFGLAVATVPRAQPALARVQEMGEGPDRVFAWVPQILTDACTGCDACVRVCPTGALTLVASGDGGGPAYAVAPAACTGCGLCTDVCDDQAMTLQPQSPAPTGPLALSVFRCAVCGVEAHLPEGSPQAQGDRCPVCRKGRRTTPLRQVID